MSKRLHAALLVLGALLLTVPVAADSNLHQLEGTLTDCGCTYFPPSYPAPEEWICDASFTVAAPAPHFSPSLTTNVHVELEEQAIGHCGAMIGSLPRKVEVLFWMEAAGLDFIHDRVRSPARGYYLIDKSSSSSSASSTAADIRSLSNFALLVEIEEVRAASEWYARKAARQ